MANVLEGDASATDARAEIDLGSNHSDIWVSADVSFSEPSRVAWLSSFSGYFMEIWNAAHDTATDATAIDHGVWTGGWGANPVPVPASGVPQTVEIHHVAGGEVKMYVDGDLIYTDVDTIGDDSRFVSFGLVTALPAATSVAYSTNLKVGSTRRGTDLFSWPSSSTDLSAFTSVSGAASVVNNPFAGSHSGAVSLPVTFSLSVRGSGFSLIPVTPASLSLAAASEEALVLTPL